MYDQAPYRPVKCPCSADTLASVNTNRSNRAINYPTNFRCLLDTNPMNAPSTSKSATKCPCSQSENNYEQQKQPSRLSSASTSSPKREPESQQSLPCPCRSKKKAAESQHSLPCPCRSKQQEPEYQPMQQSLLCPCRSKKQAKPPPPQQSLPCPCRSTNEEPEYQKPQQSLPCPCGSTNQEPEYQKPQQSLQSLPCPCRSPMSQREPETQQPQQALQSLPCPCRGPMQEPESQKPPPCPCGEPIYERLPPKPSPKSSCPCGGGHSEPMPQYSICPCCAAEYEPEYSCQRKNETPPSQTYTPPCVQQYRPPSTCPCQDLAPRPMNEIPLIPMNMNYQYSMGGSNKSGRCHPNSEYSSRGITPVPYTTDTSRSSRAPTPQSYKSREEEYYSLESDSEQDTRCSPCSKLKKNASVYKSAETVRSKKSGGDSSGPICPIRPPQSPARSPPSDSQTRNIVILRLLHEVVHLINEDESTAPCTCAAKQKIRNIGACNDDLQNDGGAFSSRTNLSNFKVTCCPPSHTSNSEPQSGGPCPLAGTCPLASTPSFEVNFPASGAQPCNVFISPNMQYPCACLMQNGQANNADVGVEVQSFSNWSPGKETINYAEMDNEQANPNVISDPEFIEDANNAIVCSRNNDPNSEYCADDCVCPLHGSQQVVAVARPSLLEKLQKLSQTPVEARTEIEPCCTCNIEEEEEDGTTDAEKNAADEIECEENDKECEEEKERLMKAQSKAKEQHGDCNCCHCRAMRSQNNSCNTIATPAQALENGGCNELKYFIDSIIMDLDAMESARRNKQNKGLNGKSNAICPRPSFPVSIVDVTDLGSTSLYVKWCIHDCLGIGGYEIYVDGHLTNRYFNCNHDAAVVCDIDVTEAHKVVLVAQPMLDDKYDSVCGDGKDKTNNQLKKCEADKGVMQLWTPSIYMYDPMSRQGMNGSSKCTC